VVVFGCVKWFSDTKGYGFVVTDDAPNVDIFVHYSAIQSEGFKSLYEGQQVQFDLQTGPKGQFAQDVTRVEEVKAEAA
jgi:cold shock protein